MHSVRVFYVYKWTHKESGKSYIGKGKGRRAWSHLNRGSLCHYFRRALEKHGRDAFELSFLALGLSEDLALFLESAAIEAYGTLGPGGYNLTGGGEGTSGYRHTELAKQKMRKPKSELACQRMSVAKRGKPGPKRSAESIRKSADAQRGRKREAHSAEAKKKISEASKTRLRGGQECARKSSAAGGSGVVVTVAQNQNMCMLMSLGASFKDAGSWFGRSAPAAWQRFKKAREVAKNAFC